METLQQLLQAIADAGPKGLRIRDREHVTLVGVARAHGYITSRVGLDNAFDAEGTHWLLTAAGRNAVEENNRPKPEPKPEPPPPAPEPKPEPPPPAPKPEPPPPPPPAPEPKPEPPPVPAAPPAPADPHADLRKQLTREALRIIERAATMEQLRDLLIPIAKRADDAEMITGSVPRIALPFTRTNARKWARNMEAHGLAGVDEFPPHNE